MSDYDLKDSGERRSFDSGAVRDIRENKGRYDLITPLGLHRVAVVYEKGAKKYEDRNWEKGIPIGDLLDSGIRHAYNYLEGKRDEDHLAQAAWNFLAAIHMEEGIKRGLYPEEYNNTKCYLSNEEEK